MCASPIARYVVVRNDVPHGNWTAPPLILKTKVDPCARLAGVHSISITTWGTAGPQVRREWVQLGCPPVVQSESDTSVSTGYRSVSTSESREVARRVVAIRKFADRHLRRDQA